MKTKLIWTVALSLLMGCSHAQVEKGLDVKLAKEPAQTRVGLSQQAQKLLDESRVPETQKHEIRSLWTQTRGQMDALQAESVKLRSLLVREVIAEKYDPNQVDLIKDRLSKVEHQRLTEYFSAIRETNRILGRWGSAGERERFYEMMEFSETGSRF